MLAYIRSNTPSQALHIPLSNLPRPDLALRTELSPVLTNAGLDHSDLLTLTELPDLKPEDTQWVLVDHNALTGRLKRYQSRVIGCVDHHVDEGTVPNDVSPRVVEPCGSCMSLVVDQYQDSWKQQTRFNASKAIHAQDSALAKIALGPILIDTINLTSKEKVKPKDLSSAALLDEIIADPSFSHTAYFDKITAVKEDISKLSFRDIFRKDYKEWEDGDVLLGISCAVQNLDYLLDKAGSVDAMIHELQSWATERHLDMVALMTTSHPKDEFQRHLFVWGVTEKGEQATQTFVNDSQEKLKLEQWSDGKLDKEACRFAWRQYELAASRKQVAPLLREAMNKVARGTNGNL